jgi:hypothetical protein
MHDLRSRAGIESLVGLEDFAIADRAEGNTVNDEMEDAPTRFVAHRNYLQKLIPLSYSRHKNQNAPVGRRAHWAALGVVWTPQIRAGGLVAPKMERAFK